jgi:hypothetical protein
MLDLQDCWCGGPAFPEPFLRHELGRVLATQGLLPPESDALAGWAAVQRSLGSFRGAGGKLRVANHVIRPLAAQIGYSVPAPAPEVQTREGMEDGGLLLQAPGAHLRTWAADASIDLDAPQRTGRAYRFSVSRSAIRVLLTRGEHLGLLTNGTELRLLLCDPARPDSHVSIPLTGTQGWSTRRHVPDSFRLVMALAAPAGVRAIPKLLEAARLRQTRVTKDLRHQARTAVEGFLQSVLDDPRNAPVLEKYSDTTSLALTLWREALIVVYRLLFILKLESTTDPARGFSFASTDLWRNALSPNLALGPLVRRHLDHGHETGHMLETGLRTAFRVCGEGLSCSELAIAPLGGALFGPEAMPLLDQLLWGERGPALLLDNLLWTRPKGRERQRVHYGGLDVEELGHVYETLLELEPAIAATPAAKEPGGKSGRAATKDIMPGRFFLRAGLGRKTTGSYYTPQAFVRFLVQETLQPQIESRSTDSDPYPAAIIGLRVADPAAGSGHFLVEACRYLGEALYAACRDCDALAAAAEQQAHAASPERRQALLARAVTLRDRITALPDPDHTLMAYMPSRAAERGDAGVSQSRALAICRRLVAIHCLYGVDQNPLAVELAKLSIWLESYAEGLPLTFLDHRLVHGDSLTGSFAAHLQTLPVCGRPLEGAVTFGVAEQLRETIGKAITELRPLQATIGRDVSDLGAKAAAKARLDATLDPVRKLARAWSGAAMLGTPVADAAWLALARSVAEHGIWPKTLTGPQQELLLAGATALPWDLTFPDAFAGATGFDVVLSNPPWDIIQQNEKEFVAGSCAAVPGASTTRASRKRFLAHARIAKNLAQYREGFQRQHRAIGRLYLHQKTGRNGQGAAGKLDAYRVFAERVTALACGTGAIGMVVPSAFHANEGATGVRRLLLEQASIEWCLSFENRRKLFEIHSGFRFALLVARKPGPTKEVKCAFYLNDFTGLRSDSRLMRYDTRFIERSGGEYATLLELRGTQELAVARRMFLSHRRFSGWAHSRGVVLGRELNMTDDRALFRPIGRAANRVLHEGKTIHQFTDRWENRPRYTVPVVSLKDKPVVLRNSLYFRAACREIASATNERTAIAAILPPGSVCGHTVNVERQPHARPNAAALTTVALMNSYAFDWMLRQKTASHVSLFILEGIPAPELDARTEHFLVHAALRLCCNDAQFAPLWTEQLGETWREPTSGPSWPVLSGEARWHLRADVDALIARAYSLTRSHYECILRSFSHKALQAMPALCLAAFDAMGSGGCERFLRERDPYWDLSSPSDNARPLKSFRYGSTGC